MKTKKYRHFWISTKFATFYVKTRKDIVVDIAPILYKFKGKHIDQLRGYIQFRNSELEEIELECKD